MGAGNPSGPSATVELLFTPFFFTPSVGGGIEDGTGVSPATGVFDLDSEALSPPAGLEAAGVSWTGAAGGESFDGDSSLIVGATNVCRALDDSFSVTTRLLFFDDDDFLRADEATAGLVDDSMVMVIVVLMSKGVWKAGMTVADLNLGASD